MVPTYICTTFWASSGPRGKHVLSSHPRPSWGKGEGSKLGATLVRLWGISVRYLPESKVRYYCACHLTNRNRAMMTQGFLPLSIFPPVQKVLAIFELLLYYTYTRKKYLGVYLGIN
jgi:hypothetical protein